MARNKSVHPSVAHYAAGCRCVDCKKLKASRTRSYRIISAQSKKPLEHGDHRYYIKMKCRCLLCRLAISKYHSNLKNSKTMNYRINLDGIYSCITKTNAPVDNQNVFDTIKGAKKMILPTLNDNFKAIKESIAHITNLRVEDLETEDLETDEND